MTTLTIELEVPDALAANEPAEYVASMVLLRPGATPGRQFRLANTGHVVTFKAANFQTGDNDGHT